MEESLEMLRVRVILSIAVIFLLAVLLMFLFLLVTSCNDCGGNLSYDETVQSINATNRQVEISLTATATAKSPTVIGPN
jgi:hypothetical protein